MDEQQEKTIAVILSVQALLSGVLSELVEEGILSPQQAGSAVKRALDFLNQSDHLTAARAEKLILKSFGHYLKAKPKSDPSTS